MRKKRNTSTRGTVSKKKMSSSKTSKTKTVKSVKKSDLVDFKVTKKNNYSGDSWVVYTTPEGRDGKRNKPKVLSGSLSRDAVRSTYAKIMGTTKEQTRSRRVSNY